MGSRCAEDGHVARVRARRGRLRRVSIFTEKSADEIRDALWERIVQKYDAKEKLVGADAMRQVERFVMLETVDRQWKDHLYSLDHLKEGIGLRGYGQKDPLVEYKKESFELFQDMKRRVDEDMVNRLWIGQFSRRQR